MTDYLGGWLTKGPIANPGSEIRALERMKAEERKVKSCKHKGTNYCAKCGAKL